MNARPIKRVSSADAVFTLSPKELIMSLLSRENIRQNILHIGTQLCQDVSWSDYTQYKTESQQLLQHSSQPPSKPLILNFSLYIYLMYDI